MTTFPFLPESDVPSCFEEGPAIDSNLAVESTAWQAQPERNRRLFDHLVPAIATSLAILDITIAQDFVHCVPQRNFTLAQFSVVHDDHRIRTGLCLMIAVASLPVSPLEAGAEVVGGIR